MFKLSNKLMAILFSVLIFFTASFSLCFAVLFLQYSDKVESNRIETRALTLADVLGKSSSDADITSMYNNNIMYILNTFNQNEVWLIDKNSRQMTGSTSNPGLSYAKLPADLQDKINTVLDGQNIRTDSFANAALTQANYTTVGVPIYNNYGQVKAALLLHSKLPKINYDWYSGLEIMAFCLIVIFICSALLLRRLVKKHIMPLNRICNAVDKLLEGNYAVNNSDEPTGRDEISLLSGKINQLAIRLRDNQLNEHDKEQFRHSFVDAAAKQLQAPLNSLHDNLDKIADADLKKKLQQDLNELNRTSYYLKELASLTSEQSNSSADLVNLLEILNTGIADCRLKAAKKHLKIISQVQLQTKIILFSGDFARLQQMFCEVIAQAADSYPDNSLLNISVSEDSSHYYVNFAYLSAKDCLPAPGQKSYVSPLALALIAKIAGLHSIEFKCDAQNQYPSFSFMIKK